ncbi:MAG: hypothetical protein M1828_005909 [Chrysothrix sp. TS-e1954]|nr:MAG: hypothetical protein M1828_005909 [Chrysothrix sp. TS-e1954]
MRIQYHSFNLAQRLSNYILWDLQLDGQPDPSTSIPSPHHHPHGHRPPLPATTPRRTLTDDDRRKMCLYHDENPSKKQTEIGELFGVERSTVSKVLRHKEKYLQQEPEGNRSPMRKSKGKRPDLDRSLAKWIQNQQSKGVNVTDDIIKEKARFFWMAGGYGSECPVNIHSQSWLEKLKQKANLPGLQTRIGSPLGDDDTSFSTTPGPAFATTNERPVSGGGTRSRHMSPKLTSIGSAELHSARSHDTFGSMDSEVNADSDLGLGIQTVRASTSGSRLPFSSQSNNSLSSAFAGSACTENTNASDSPPTAPAQSYYPVPPPPPVPQQTSPVGSLTGGRSPRTHYPPLRPRRRTYPNISAKIPTKPPAEDKMTTDETRQNHSGSYISPPLTTPPDLAPRLTPTTTPVDPSMPPPPSTTATTSIPHQSYHPRVLAPGPKPTLITQPLPQPQPGSMLVTPPASAPSSLFSPWGMDGVTPSSAHLPSAEDAQKGLEVAVQWLTAQPSSHDWAPELHDTRQLLLKVRGVCFHERQGHAMPMDGVRGLAKIEEM